MNLDAMYLRNLAQDFSEGDPDENSIKARLLRIADNLEGMDQRNAILSENDSYAKGYAAAEARMAHRSNILANPQGEIDRGAELLEKHVPVKRIPLGVRALEDQPHTFNAPIRNVPKKAAPKIDLDLSILEDL